MLTSDDLKPIRLVKYPKNATYLDCEMNQYKVVLPKLDRDSIESILLPKLKNDGLCIVSSSISELADFANLIPYLGQSFNQGKSTLSANNLNYFVVQIVAGTKISGLTNKDQAMHVDGFYGRELPGVMLLHCLSQANIGGESVLADGLEVYKFLERTYPQGLEALKHPEALEFDFLVGGTKTKLPIFTQRENGRIEFFYTPYAKTIEGNPEAEKAYMIVSHFIHTTENQIKYKLEDGEFLLLDNLRYAHGRLGFQGNKMRQMNRIWFTGNKSYLGFTV